MDKVILVVTAANFCIASGYISRFRVLSRSSKGYVPIFDNILGRTFEIVGLILSTIALAYLLDIKWYWSIVLSGAMHLVYTALYISVSMSSRVNRSITFNPDMVMGKGFISFIIGIVAFVAYFIIY